MGAGGPSGGSADAPNTTRSQLSKKNQDKLTDRNQKNKTEFGYEKPTSVVNNNGGNGGEGTNILIAPTVAEVSQSNAANATTPVEEDPLYLRKKKTQAKGRSATILTSSKGVNEDSTLGKKSLLGA